MERSFVRRFLFDQLPVRGAYVELTDVWLTISAQKEYPDGIRQFLGELIAANILMTSSMKLQGKVIAQINDNPKVDLVVSECTHDLKVRATAKFSVGTHKDAQVSYKDCASGGILVISVDSSTDKKRYQSVAVLANHDLATALDEYMIQSEQLKSLFVLVYTESKIVGLMLQQLPDHADKYVDEVARIFVLAGTLTRDELLRDEIDVLLQKIFAEDDIVIFDRQAVTFSCTCSHDKVSGMLLSLGKEEAQSIIAEMGKIEVTCDFCNMHYVFSEQDITDMFSILCVDIESISKEIH